MCVMSMIMDQHTDRWSQNFQYYGQVPSQAEIDEFYRILEKARQWDIEHNEPDCESEAKRQKLLDLAEELGVEIEFV